MAVKNNQNAESNGGFKTVAFGFDKNDVNMYIANLRKKMKTMEEEFEQKLSSALENPAASSDVLKHEREVIRAETEKLWGEKLNERNQILKQQQVRINELEDELRVNKEKVASLRTQLSAATSDSNSDGVISARAAKAYMQFTRELRHISSSVEKTLEQMEKQWRGELSEAAAKYASEENNAASAVETAEAPDNITAETNEGSSENTPAAADTSAAVSAPAAAPINAPVKTWSEALEEPEKEDPISSLIADISEPDGSGYAVDIAPQKNASGEAVMEIDSDLLAEPLPAAAAPKPAPKKSAPPKPAIAQKQPEKTKAQEKKPEPAPAPKPAPKANPAAETTSKSGAKRISMPEPKPANEAHPAIEEVDFDLLLEKPVPEAAVSDDFDSLLVDDMSDDGLAVSPEAPAAPAKKAEKAKPKIEIDDDLSALLAEDDLSELLVTPSDNTVGADEDFEKIMSEPEAEPDYGEDLFFTENDRKESKGDDLDATFLSDIVINPGEIKEDLGEMLVTQEKAEEEAFKDMFVTAADDSDRNDGLGINVGSIDFGMDSADSLAEKTKSAKSGKKDDDLFDFSFLAPESDDEDDMSTDASFPGML